MLRAQETSDDAVIELVLGGSPRAFESLMRRYNARLFRITRGILGSDAEAEDAMQDAYVQAFTHLAAFERRASFATWLTRIAVHSACARVRARKRETLAPDLDDTQDRIAPEALPMSAQSMARSPEDRADAQQTTHALERAIDALPEHYRSVFVLRALEGASVAEAATCLEITEETVRTRYHRARALLQGALRDRAEERAFELHLSRCDHIVARVLARLGI